MKVMVTGAGGYIGVPLCSLLLNEGHDVVALDRFYFGQEKLRDIAAHPKLDVVIDDIRFMNLCMLDGVDTIIDLAGLSNDAASDLDTNLTLTINQEGPMRLARAAKKRGVKRYVYSSSAAVFGSGEKMGLTEEDECFPQTAYAKSKLAVERALATMKSDAFEVVIFRNATVFGLAPRMRFDLAVNIMTLRARKERVIYIMGGGEQWRPFVHVSDVARALYLGATLPAETVNGQSFNVGGRTMNYQIRQLAQLVLDVVPNVRIHNIPDDPDRRTYNLSFEKIARELSFEPAVGVQDGIAEILHALECGLVDAEDPTCYTLAWYKSIMEWEKRIAQLSYEGQSSIL